MIKDYAYGVVVVCQSDHDYHYLLVRHRDGGHRGLPKGHADEGESPRETAIRELAEETGVSVSVDDLEGVSFSESYRCHSKHHVDHMIEKTVTYFVSQVDSRSDLTPQMEEVSDLGWYVYEKASDMITFDECRHVLQKVHAFVSS